MFFENGNGNFFDCFREVCISMRFLLKQNAGVKDTEDGIQLLYSGHTEDIQV